MSNENGKHTQGEWRVGDPNKNILEQKHQVMCGKKVLATGNQNFIEQAEIDIALMASAPDLAQLNKEMLAMLKTANDIISTRVLPKSSIEYWKFKYSELAEKRGT